MQEKIEGLLAAAKEEIAALSSSRELAECKVKYLGKTGLVTALLKQMKDIPPEKRSEFGKSVNALKEQVSALFEEREKGTLAPGKRADLVILDRDPLACPAEELRDLQVLETIKDGKTVYRKK